MEAKMTVKNQILHHEKEYPQILTDDILPKIQVEIFQRMNV